LARDPRQAPERFLAPISSICTTAGEKTWKARIRTGAPMTGRAGLLAHSQRGVA